MGNGEMHAMAALATTQANPVSDLMFDWLSVLHAKAAGLNA
jgi:hypothetical protein